MIFIGLKKLVINITKYAITVSFVLAAFYLISYQILPSFFIDNLEVKNIFSGIFWIIIISQPMNAVAFALDGVFKGLGEAVYLRNVLIISTFLLFIPAIYMLDYFNFGLSGVWYSFLIWMGARAVLLALGFKNYLKKHATA